MTTTSPTTTSTAARRRLQGLVVSAKMAKTVVIRIDRRVPHKIYGKYSVVSTKLKVHDETGETKVGDLIEVEETRPVSKDKRFRFIRVVTAAK